jgi:hypothetical protein
MDMKTAPTMQAVITELAAQHDVALTETGAYLHLDMVGYDQLRIEHLPNGCISVAHVFEVQGFLIPEPDVCFFVDAQGGWAPINITQSMIGYRVYAELSEDGSAIVRYNRRRQVDLADFCETWAQNLRDQGWLEHAVKHQLSGNHLFALGQIVATPGALDALEQAGQTLSEFLNRHVTGDWGDLDEHDRTENDRALKQGSRLFSAYHLNDGTKIWLITEWDRSVTTLLLPEDY